MPSRSEPSRPIYTRRRPEKSVLYRVVHENLPTFVGHSYDPDSGETHLPRFVLREFERYVGCGLLSRGFLRAVCSSCRENVLIAFSCQGRGFCPSCCTRRMEDTTEHVIERVLPDAPIRQWVLSLPFEVRGPIAFRQGLFPAIVRMFMSEVSRCIRAKAVRSGVAAPLFGGIAFLQRFGSTLNLNPHIHAVVMDGVFVQKAEDREDDELYLFQAVSEPTGQELQDVSERVCRRVIRLLKRAGIVAEDALVDDAASAERAVQENAARVLPLFAVVARDGEVLPVFDRGQASRAGDYRGFSTHAGVSCRGGDIDGRRRIVRYCVRPPFAERQVQATCDGRVGFELRHPRKNGATHVVFSELGFVCKLAALVPPPAQHQTRYFGVLCSSSRHRRFVIPPRPVSIRVSPFAIAMGAPMRTPWADLLHKVYGIDALKCPRCLGQLRVIAAIKEASVIRKILEHLGLFDEPDRRARRTTDLVWTEP